MATTRRRYHIEKEIVQELGLVPGYFKSIPEQYLDAEWELFKSQVLRETLVAIKYKELMGVALHAGTKNRYCTLFHTETAKLFGATDAEIQETVHYATMSVGWSIYLNGIQTDLSQYKNELNQISEYLKTKKVTHAY